MSAKILAQRSAIPAVSSRSSASSSESKRSKLSHEEKSRLLRTAKRLRKGPLNSYVDPTELGAGSVAMDVSEAVKNSGAYDVWLAQDEMDTGNGRPVLAKPKVYNVSPRR
jgi:nucleolar protein 53